MPLQGTYEPSPVQWVRDQVAEYESSKGRRGTTMRGMPVILLTTVGRKSGNLRKAPLMRVFHDGDYAAVASVGGAPEHPAWYHNLVAHPACTVQDGPTISDRVARELEGAEREEWWARCVEAFPDYAEYETRTDRVIPVMLLEADD